MSCLLNPSGEMYLEDNICDDVLTRATVIFGLTWQLLGLVIILGSLWGIQLAGKGAMHALFWASITLAYALNVSFRIGVLANPDVFTNFVVNILFALALAFIQFSYAIVVLLLQRLCSVYDVGGDGVTLKDRLWLIFCAVQIPINLALAIIRAETNNSNMFFWSPINIFLTQLMTIAVFAYYRRLIQLRARETAVSVRTHDLLEYTIERFTEFSMVYVLYALATFWGFMAAFADMAQAIATNGWGYIGVLYILSEPVANVYVTLSVMAIFRPKWYMWIRRIKVGGTFREPGFLPTTTTTIGGASQIGTMTSHVSVTTQPSRTASVPSTITKGAARLDLPASVGAHRRDSDGGAVEGNSVDQLPRVSAKLAAMAPVTEESGSANSKVGFASPRTSVNDTVGAPISTRPVAGAGGADGPADIDSMNGAPPQDASLSSFGSSSKKRRTSLNVPGARKSWSDFSMSATKPKGGSSSPRPLGTDDHAVIPLSRLGSSPAPTPNSSRDRLRSIGSAQG